MGPIKPIVVFRGDRTVLSKEWRAGWAKSLAITIGKYLESARKVQQWRHHPKGMRCFVFKQRIQSPEGCVPLLRPLVDLDSDSASQSNSAAKPPLKREMRL